MDTKSLVFVLAGLFTTALAGLVSVPTVEVLQGPGSKTTIVGPDGGTISSASPGGTVVTDGSALVPVAPAVLAAGPQIVVGGGPAGSIITSYTAAGPAVIPAVAAAAPAVLAAASVAAIPTAADEGQYVPDNTEQLFDDGSYKGE